MMRRAFLTALTTLLAVYSLFGDYPLIREKNKSQDLVFLQQQQDVSNWYSGMEDPPPIVLFRYKPDATESLFTVAADFNLPYETLSTLNSWDSPALFAAETEILVSNLPGLFIQELSDMEWDKNMIETRQNLESSNLVITTADGITKTFKFFPGEKFTPEERIRFLGNLFSTPLDKIAVITSHYGYRNSPITGKISFHPGIDLRVEIGTPVLCARNGVVSDIGTLEIYGLYLIINHDGGYQTVYAHLKEVLVTQGQRVNAGSVVALSGNSGISTGSHLHFEIRRNERPINPLRVTALRR